MRKRLRKKPGGDGLSPAATAVGSQKDREHWTTWGIAAGLVVLVALVFGQTVWFDFVNLDDGQYVYQNSHLADGLTSRGIAWAFTENRLAAHWHPLTWVSLLVDSHFYGQSHAGGYHATNVLLHAATAVLLFLVLRQLTGDVWPSAFVAAVFAVHPLHVESVAWITERKDVLSGLFGVLALGAYTWYARRPGVVRYLAVGAALALGLMSKPMLVTWPFVFLLLDYWPLGRAWGVGRGAWSVEQRADVSDSGQQVQRAPGSRVLFWLALEKVPLLLLVAASAAFTIWTQQSGGAVLSLQTMSLSARILRAAVLYVDYLGKLILPVNLAIYPAEPLVNVAAAWGCLALLALLTAAAIWRAAKGERWLAVGWFWYLGTLLPVIGLIQVGLQVRADRFLYLPQIGLCIALAWSMTHLLAIRSTTSLSDDWRSSGRSIAGTAAFLIVIVLAVIAFRQTACWRDSEALWTRALACTRGNCVAHYNYGQFLVERQRPKEAVVQLQQAVKIKPDFAEAENELGNALLACGRPDMALAHFQKAVALQPDFADTYGNLGVALVRCGRPQEAIEPFQRSLKLGSPPAAALTNLGNALAACNRLDEATDHFQQALKFNPQHVDAHYGLAAAYLRKAKFAEAIDHFQTGLKINPGNPSVENNLGVALLNTNKYQEAAEHFRKALQLKPDYVEARRNLQFAQSKLP